jgi:glycosylphosphatidylinositol transamidase
MQSFSLLFLGATFSTWATLNFSLALMVGLLAFPLGFVRPLPLWNAPPSDPAKQKLALILSLPAALAWFTCSPPAAVYALSWYAKKDLGWVLLEMAKGWSAQGAWSTLVLWSVWWPAWVIGGVVLFSGAVKTTK